MADCNNPNAEEVTTYVPPALCMPGMQLQADTACGSQDATYAEKLAAEALEIAGVGINVFKLLGIHEQGQMVDLTGNGFPISSGTAAGSNISSAFDLTIGTIWRSSLTGAAIISAPAYLGYFFGTKKTNTGTERYGRPQFLGQNISMVKIRQSADPMRRATRLRLDRSDGSLHATTPVYLGTGDGQLVDISPGYNALPGTITVTAVNATTFDVYHSAIGSIGQASTTTKFIHTSVSFILLSGSVPFVAGDIFMFDTALNWKRVDVQNVVNSSNLETVNFKPSVMSPYWRIVPLEFTGSADPTAPWEIDQLQMMDYQQTSIDNIQDIFFQENRDRDYASCSLQLRAQYTPFDSIGDLGKFGLSVLDQYVFTVSFARMIEVLGRPIVTGDIVEVSAEMQWDHNMKPVKKYLEVTDTGWSSEGFTPGWKPILYRFQAVPLTPSQENRDIVGTADSYLHKTSDQSFFDQFDKQIATLNTEASEENAASAKNDVPETGQDPMDIASGSAVLGTLTTPDNHDLYIEDGLPPDGIAYGEGYALPDVTTMTDGEYFRLNYPPEMGIPSRLYKFNGVKGRFLYVETDRRMEGSSFKKSIRKIMQQGGTSLKG